MDYTTKELLQLVDEYMDEWTGEPDDKQYLVDEIKGKTETTWLYDEFMEWVKDTEKDSTDHYAETLNCIENNNRSLV